MARKSARSAIEHAKRCFTALGKTPAGIPRGTQFAELKAWRHPLLSLHLPRKLTPRCLDAFAAFIRKAPRRQKIEYSKPYFNLLTPASREGLSRVRKIAARLGYRYDAPQGTVCYFNRPRYFELPESYEFEIGRSFEPSVRAGLRELLKAVFKSKPARIRMIEAGIRGAYDPHTVIVRTRRGRVAGGGAFFVRGEYAYLFSGAVMPLHRKRGLWKAVLSARQLFSVELGARHWALTTFNEHIGRIHDRRFLNHSFIKGSLNNK